MTPQQQSPRQQGPRYLTNTEPALRHGWHPVARSRDVTDEPTAVGLLGQAWVIARLDDRIAAFEDRCPHRLVPLSAGRIEGAELVCGYHGWRFGASGECTAVPSLGPGVPAPRKARATVPWAVAERYGLVWIAPREPFAELIDLPEHDGPEFDDIWLEVASTRAPAGLLADNFLDTAHFPFVHAATIGTEAGLVVPPYTVEADGDGFRVVMEQEVANPEDPGVAAGIRPLVQRRISTYVYRPPFMLRLRTEYPDAGITNTIFFCLQPESAGSTRIYTRLLRDDLGGDAARMAESAAFEQAILDEDLALQNRFALPGLPLRPEEEVSMRADAAGVALRRVLAAFVRRAEAPTRTPRSSPAGDVPSIAPA